jgi:hypothetical protein
VAKHFVRKKNSPVISPNLQANRGVPENITGDNRCCAFCSVTRVQCKAHLHARRRDRSLQEAPARKFEPSARERAGSLPARVDVFHARPPAEETPNMATRFSARNATKLQLRKIVGTKIESLARIFGECFCGSGG